MTRGIFALIAESGPLKRLSLNGLLAVSNLVRGGIVIAPALAGPNETANLRGDNILAVSSSVY